MAWRRPGAGVRLARSIATASPASSSICRSRTTRRLRTTVSSLAGKHVGFSMFTGYSHNERCGLSLGVVDEAVNVGDELTLIWGEEQGGTRKPTVERHRQCEIRVRVAAVPYSRDAREGYKQGWRTRQA